jgi:hypothetical protein
MDHGRGPCSSKTASSMHARPFPSRTPRLSPRRWSRMHQWTKQSLNSNLEMSRREDGLNHLPRSYRNPLDRVAGK